MEKSSPQNRISFWNRLLGRRNTDEAKGHNYEDIIRDPSHYAFVDIEVGLTDHKVHDIGAILHNGDTFHKASKRELTYFLQNTDFLCGHNIIQHDAKYLFGDEKHRWLLVDTLYMSPILFPERPYHRLVKDDKLQNDQLNNPVNDCEKARDLLWDEIEHWNRLSAEKRSIYTSLLADHKEFQGFLAMVQAKDYAEDLPGIIRKVYEGNICQHADIERLISEWPCELAYALALIGTSDFRSTTPGWVLHNYPNVEYIVRLLRHTRCADGCSYCNTFLDVHQNLHSFFGYREFRTFEGENLQEKAAKAAVNGKSLLAIFPTGGGKSLTFQLPALMEGRTVHGLTTAAGVWVAAAIGMACGVSMYILACVATALVLLGMESMNFFLYQFGESQFSVRFAAPTQQHIDQVRQHLAQLKIGIKSYRMELAGFQRCDQCLCIDQAAAGCVNQHNIVFHLADRLSINHMVSSRLSLTSWDLTTLPTIWNTMERT